MSITTDMPASVAVRPAAARGGDIEGLDVCGHLRAVAASLRSEADALAALLPAGKTDVRVDIALLRMVAGNVGGYAETMEAGQ